MLNLDALEALEGSEFGEELKNYRNANLLYIQFAVHLVKGRLLWPDFKRITEALGVYQYVLPRDRDFVPELSDWIYQKNRYNLFNLALLVGHIEANLNVEQQYILLRELERQENAMP